MCTVFWTENLKGRDYSEDLGVDGRKIGKEDVDCMHLDQDKEQWRALLNMVLKLQVP
jgi:hypothetical protein